MKTMKTLMSLLIAGTLFTGCERPPMDTGLEQGRAKILKQAVAARDSAERRLVSAERENRRLTSEIEVLRHRLEIALHSEVVSQRLLDDSNRRKLDQAGENIRIMESVR